LNIQNAIMIKKADSNKEIVNLIEAAKGKGIEVYEFTREMIETTDDKKIIETTKSKDFDEIEFLGVLVFGNKKDIEDLTDQFQLVK